jgi:hypothetical protein
MATATDTVNTVAITNCCNLTNFPVIPRASGTPAHGTMITA